MTDYMLHAIDQALETNYRLGRLFGQLDGERWEKICKSLEMSEYTGDSPTFMGIELIFQRLWERAK